MKETIFALDIGDLFLKFTLCEKEGDRVRAVLWGMEELNEIFWHQPFERIWKLLGESGATLQKQGTPLRVLVTFSPSVMKTRVTEYAYTRAHAKEAISQEEYAFTLKAIKAYVQDSLLQTVASQFGIVRQDLLLRDLHFMETTIDGYSVPRLLGFRGKEVSVRLLVSFVFKSYAQIGEAIPRFHRLPPPFFISEAEGIYRFVNSRHKEGIFIDIGDKTTHLIVAASGQLASVEELPFGGDIFTHVLTQALGMRRDSARAMKERYGMGMLSLEDQGRIRALFLPETQKFVTMITERLRLSETFLPQTIFLFGGGAALGEIKEEFEKEYFVSVLCPKDLWEISNLNQLTNPQYTPLLFALYVLSQQPS
ncbi:MAG: cell division FtsA domain-containing protein [Candidatus Wildermuthbacteria bacterium]|nr:cell division FtsA domain-containing protein [Candidatus Wildermuthbacteria bacterium]